MNSDKIRICILAVALGVLLSAGARANDDWAERTFKTEGGGALFMSYPLSWGRKPAYETFDTITDIRFGPYGPRAKPLFLVHLQAVVAAEAATAGDLEEIARIEIENLRTIAFETDIPIGAFDSPANNGVYFTITDKESKRGEFDYLTMAVVAAGKLLVKVYFLSNDGAPNFGADAMQMMSSLRYITQEELDKK